MQYAFSNYQRFGLHIILACKYFFVSSKGFCSVMSRSDCLWFTWCAILNFLHIFAIKAVLECGVLQSSTSMFWLQNIVMFPPIVYLYPRTLKPLISWYDNMYFLIDPLCQIILLSWVLFIFILDFVDEIKYCSCVFHSNWLSIVNW